MSPETPTAHKKGGRMSSNPHGLKTSPFVVTRQHKVSGRYLSTQHVDADRAQACIDGLATSRHWNVVSVINRDAQL